MPLDLRFLAFFVVIRKLVGKLTLSPRHVEILDKFHFFYTFASAFNDGGHTFLRPGVRKKNKIKIERINPTILN